MDREKAIQILKRCEAESHCEHYKRHYCCIGCDQREALDLAIEALEQPEIVRCKGCNYFLGADEDTFCGLCSREDTQGVAESATTTDCNYTCSDCKHQDKAYEQEPCHSCFNNDGAGYEPDTDCISRADTIKAMCRECKVFLGDGVNCADCTEVAIVKGMPPCNQKQITGKLESVETATSEGEESTMGQPKSKLDCISREFALEVISDYVNYPTEGDKTCAIKNAPSVTPTERTTETMIVDGEETKIDPVSYEIGYSHGQVAPTERTGEWVTHYETYEDSGETVPYGVECPFCGRWEEYKEPFCNCGAKMGGDTE